VLPFFFYKTSFIFVDYGLLPINLIKVGYEQIPSSIEAEPMRAHARSGARPAARGSVPAAAVEKMDQSP